MSHFQQQGRDAYKRKDYAKALSLFDRAIGRGPSVQLYDNRAACHEKQGDLDAALKDAKKAIQLSKEDPTGFLRAGRVLVRMQKQSTALEVYTYGLNNVKHIGQGYELLRKVHSELMTELSPTKSVDPLTVLPRELAEMILDYLTFRQLMNTCLVSKQWSDFIRTTPNLWRHLDFTHTRRKIKNAFISRAINVARNKLKAVTLNNLYELDKPLAALVHNCPLEEVAFLNTGLQNQNIVALLKRVKNLKSLRFGSGTTIGDSILSQILYNATSLVSLQCDDFTAERSFGTLTLGPELPNLRTLDLAWSKSWLGSLQVMQQIDKMPNLATLRLQQLGPFPHPYLHCFDLSRHQHLEHVDLLLNMHSSSQMKPPPNVKSLALGTWQPDCKRWFDLAVPLNWSTMHMKELKLGMAFLPFEACLLVLNQYPTQEEKSSAQPCQLKSLSMARCDLEPDLDDTPGQHFLRDTLKHSRLVSLEDLDLQKTLNCDDTIMGIIGESLPTLRSLNVSETDITGVGLKQVVKRGELKKLVVNDCRRLGDDAVAWARAQGVQVEHKTTSAFGGGGKKVRY